jgi:hypothetical protein
MAQQQPQGGIVASVIGAGIGFLAGKLAAFGVHLDAGAQAAVTIAVYGVVHRLLGRFGI